MNFTIAELREATGGILHHGEPGRPIHRICTDTRILREGEAFVALDGKNFHGETFIAEALRKGASGVITTASPDKSFPEDRFFIQVKDSLEALGDVAREWRRVVDPTVCALTGSAGKTTTKEMIAHICREKFRCLSTQGNFNNLIGLPLTLLRLEEEHEVAIVETGMNQAGELMKLAQIALPDISVITNIGNAHIGNFGCVEGLIRAKAELFEAMPRHGTAIINADCPHASMMAEAFDIPELVISYGQNEEADVRAENVTLCAPFGYTFDLKILDTRRHVHLKVFGRYQLSNALAAAAAAATLGVGPEEIARRLEDFEAPDMRSRTEWLDGIFIVSDCYNASPDAMIASMNSLKDVSGIARRFAVIGDMRELGEHSEKYHRNAGIALAEAQIDYLCTYGKDSIFVHEEAERKGIAAKHFESREEIAEFLHSRLERNDALIIKGSRDMKLEEVLRRLKEMRAAVRNGDSALQPTEENSGPC